MRPLEDQEVREIPGTAVFECEISKANMKAEWQRAGKVISAGDKYEMSVEGGVHKLIVHNVDDLDEDNYTVVIRDVQSTAKLTVIGEENLFALFYDEI